MSFVEENDRLRASIRRLEAERDARTVRSWGAVREHDQAEENDRLRESITRLEARTERAEAERDRARDLAQHLEEENYRLSGIVLLNAVFPENRPPKDGAPRWDHDPIVLQFGWLEGRCARCGEDFTGRDDLCDHEVTS